MSTQQKPAAKAHNTRSASAGQEDKEMNIPKPIDEKEFKTLDSDKKLDRMAAAINKLATNIDVRMESLSKQIEDKVDPI